MRSGLLVCVCFAVSVGVAHAEPPSTRASSEDQMALLVDRTRVEAGLLPLARSKALDEAASLHAQDMVVHGYMEHEGLDGSTPQSRASDAGYVTPARSAWLVVEVISARGNEPDAAVSWWLGDGLHRRVVLKSNWREMGIGFAPGGPYGRFWVMLFGCRPNILPPVLLDGVLSIPDERCGAAADAFGRVDAVRIGSSEWQPYEPARAWRAGQPAQVQLRDVSGQVLEAAAADPTGANAEAP